MTSGRKDTLSWDEYHAPGWELAFPPGSTVLDIGSGAGTQLEQLAALGHKVKGVEPDAAQVAACRARGLDVVQGFAEHLGEPDASYDGVVCKVVIPYTLEDQTIAEIARVLRPGGTCYLVSHGAGYFLRYLLQGTGWKFRVYGLRSLLNTWWWALTGTRLPGFMGDTLYQSRRRLARYYSSEGLLQVSDAPSRVYLWRPVFIHHILERRGALGESPRI